MDSFYWSPPPPSSPWYLALFTPGNASMCEFYFCIHLSGWASWFLSSKHTSHNYHCSLYRHRPWALVRRVQGFSTQSTGKGMKLIFISRNYIIIVSVYFCTKLTDAIHVSCKWGGFPVHSRRAKTPWVVFSKRQGDGYQRKEEVRGLCLWSWDCLLN